MVDVARLQVEVDSRQVRKAGSDLGGFSKSSSKAERSSKGFANQSKRTAKAVSSMNRSVNLLKGAMGGLLAAFSLRAIQQFTASAINAADQIGKLSATAGVSAETLQELRFAFGQLAGTTDTEVDAALRRFNRRLGLAADGGGAAKDTFEQLGISITDASGRIRNGELVLDDLLIQLSQIENDSQRAALASQAFGEDAGPRLAAALGEGEQAVEAMRQEAQDLGIVLGGDAIESAERFSDQMDVLNKTLMVNFQEGLLSSIAGDADSFADAIADPEFQQGIETLGKFIGESLKFMVDNADTIIKTGQALALIGLSAKLGGAVGGRKGAIAGAGVGTALFALSQAISDATDTADNITQESRNAERVAKGGDNQPQVIEGPEKLPNVRLINDMQFVGNLNTEFEGIDLSVQQIVNNLPLFDKMMFSIGESVRDVSETMETGIGNALEDLIVRGEDAKDVFKQLAAEISTAILRQQVINPAASAITSAIGGFFPGGGQTGGQAATTAQMSNMSFIPQNANGGNVFGGSPSIVGERGPELFVPSQDGQIVPNHRMGGGGDVTVNIINQGGEQLQAEQQQSRRGANGEMTVDVMVKSSIERLDGQGQLDGVFRRHGAARQGQF